MHVNEYCWEASEINWNITIMEDPFCDMGRKFRNLGAEDKKHDIKSWLKNQIHKISGSYNYKWHKSYYGGPFDLYHV